MIQASVDFAAVAENARVAPPLPLAICWTIWILMSAGLWAAVWRIATFFI